MSPILIISIATFLAVMALVAGIALLVRDFNGPSMYQRLKVLNKKHSRQVETLTVVKEDAFREGLEGLAGSVNRLLLQWFNLNKLFEQADSPITGKVFLILTGVCGLLGVAAAAATRAPVAIFPLSALAFCTAPFIWLLSRRRQRLQRFSRQLPDGLELLSRALRSGHSLQSAIGVVADEMLPPIATEFAIFSKAQSLGTPIEDAFNDMLQRVPNADLQFFVTCVNMQRQCGGNLAEILDKIAYIVRERFKILGQVRALTGEGRISGVVLMALPVVLFFAVYHLSPEYVMLLFTDPMGRKMLAVAAVLQIVGAFAIKKIVDIKI
jgi:tight adherence protein B